MDHMIRAAIEGWRFLKEDEMPNSGSCIGNTTTFYSIKFKKNVREYRGYVIVPFEVTGSRGGARRLWDIYDNAQRTRYNHNIRSLARAKSLIDSGLSDMSD